MHLFAPEEGILGTVPIVAATVPLAAGAALAYKMRGEKRVAVAFFGDGTLEEGHVHETFNLAALYRLPLVISCARTISTPVICTGPNGAWPTICTEPASSTRIPGQRVDGNDVEAVFTRRQPGGGTRARWRRAIARSNAGPFAGAGTWAPASMWMSAWQRRGELDRMAGEGSD